MTIKKRRKQLIIFLLSTELLESECRQHVIARPDLRAFKQLVAVSEWETLASPDFGTLSSGVVRGVIRDSTRSLPTFVITDLSQVAIFKTSVKTKDCVSSSPSETGLHNSEAVYSVFVFPKTIKPPSEHAKDCHSPA